MSFIVVIDAILVMLAMLLFLWTWAKSKSKKSKAQSDGSSSNTQKISAIGKTIFGALKKIIYWALIIGLIAGAALALYCFLFPSVDTIYFTPDQWSKKSHGWQKAFDLEEPGTYEINVSGSYNKCFLRDGKKELWQMPPNGITRRNWPSSECRRHLPLPNRPLGMVIARVNKRTVPFGYGKKIKVNKPTNIYLNINIPQNWTKFPGKTPADNFIHNTGTLRVTVEKDRAIFSKIAEIFNSLKQHFEGDD